jgi:hypothetical protein
MAWPPSIDLLPEYLDADLGDKRRSERLLRLAAAVAANPSASFRHGLGGGAALEGGYRFINNEAVEAEDILGPHQRQTRERASQRHRVIAIHDTTELAFEGDTPREGLGRLRKKDGMQGFYLHTTLLVEEDSLRTPLGVVRFGTHARGEEPTGKKSHRSYRDDPSHEGRRWLEGVLETEEQLEGPDVTHVMDREADSFELMSSMEDRQARFVVRMCSDRATTEGLEGSKGHVSVRDTLESAVFLVTREVALSARSTKRTPGQTKNHSPRDRRAARLQLRACPVALLRPTSLGAPLPPRLGVHAVQVFEVDPPEHEKPIEWTLLTNLSIATAKDVERVVDIYRARWTIEEFFKALKTGCSIEKREHESFHALRNVVALYLPIAWRLLALRNLGRVDSSLPATYALTEAQIEVLRALHPKPLPDPLSVTDAMWALAATAGHDNRRTRPGWRKLGEALDKLLFAERVWLAARKTTQM